MGRAVLLSFCKLRLSAIHLLLGVNDVFRITFFIGFTVSIFGLRQGKLRSLPNLLNQRGFAARYERLVLLSLVGKLLCSADGLFTHTLRSFTLAALLVILVLELVQTLLNLL